MDKPSRRLTSLEDPRGSNTVHRLGDIILIAVASALCGGATCVAYAQFAHSKKAFLEKLLGPFTPPSHDTFSRLFRLLDPEAFGRCFAQFAAAFADSLDGVVAIDGKALRRAHETGLATSPPLMVTAWAANARLALAGVMPDPAKGENEVSAALAVLDLLDLTGTVVTADALHTHRRMAAKILERGGDYALCLKGNQMKIKRDAEAVLEAAKKVTTARSSALAHGRRETRSLRIANAPGFAEKHDFPGVAAIAEVTTRRGNAKPKTRLFLFSRKVKAPQALQIVRAHWTIENNLHWSLDVVFKEDEIRARKDNAPANIALINRAALNIVNAIDDPKTSKRQRLMRCAWEDAYLEKAIAHMR